MLFAQRNHFKQYTVDDGLAHNQAYDVLQAKDGRIWIATLGGVSVFNGNSFVNYTKDDGLPSNLIMELFEDSSGRMWIATVNKGVCYIKNGRVIVPQDYDYFKLGAVNGFLEDKNGVIYIFANQGILTFENGKHQELDTSRTNGYLPNDAIWEDENTILMTSIRNGLFRITVEPFDVQVIDNKSHGINNVSYSVYREENGTIWVGCYGGLFKIEGDTTTEYLPDPNNVNDNRIWSISAEGTNYLMLGTEGNGLLKFNKTTKTFEVVNAKNGLPSNYIYHHIKDTENNYWMASYSGGLIRYRDDAFLFYDADQGLPNSTVSTALPWRDFWVVTTDNGLAFIKDGRVIATDFIGTKIIECIVTTKDQLLLATETEVHLYNDIGNRTLFAEGDYSDLYEDEDYTFLIGGKHADIHAKDSVFKIPFRRTFRVVPFGEGHAVARLSSILQLKDFKRDTIAGLHPKKHDLFFSVESISNNEFLALNDKNLYRVKRKKDKDTVQIIDLKRFGALKNIKAMRASGDYLWLASENTFSKVHLKKLMEEDSLDMVSYKSNSGFVSYEINNDNLEIDANGNLLGASDYGMVVFSENDYLTHTAPPAIDLKGVMLFAEPLEDSLYREEDKIVLPYKKNYLTFSMEAITFTFPETVLYKYRLKGLRDGDEWSSPTQKTEVVFSYLPPGDYTFEFTADNGNGIWQDSVVSYPFTIKVPFWRTPLFWFVTLTLISLGTVFILYLRNKRLQLRRQKFTQGLIKAQEEERTRVARELHDSVGQKLMLLTKKTKTFKDESIGSLADNTLEELRSISRGLHPANLEKLGLTKAIEVMINEVDANTNIFFTNEIENIDGVLNDEEALHLYRIIQEVLNNMVKHAEAKSASVTIEHHKQSIEAIIKDNGVGFQFSEKLKSGASLGMNTLMERAHILKSKLEIKSEPHKGTVIELKIPI